MLTAEKTTELLIKGHISEMTPEIQAQVRQCAQTINEIIEKNGAAGLLAMALVGAELAAKDYS